MAFDLDNFDKASQEGIVSVPRLWAYVSTTDALAAIAASGYFNSQDGKMKIGDYIFINATDGGRISRVTAISPNVTTATVV